MRRFICTVLLSLTPSVATLAQQPQKTKPDVEPAIRAVAGSAEFLRHVPKHFGTLVSVDAERRTVSLKLDQESEPTTWTLTPDAELKVQGWWGRLDQFQAGDRVWAWFSVDRAKKRRGIFMLADQVSEQVIHGLGDRKLAKLLDQDQLEKARRGQQQRLRQIWLEQGLPGTVGFLHVYSGETDVLLDHEAMRWARSLSAGAQVELRSGGPIKAVVKSVTAQREKTQVRLVVHSLDLAALATGQRVHLKMKPPLAEVEDALVPPDIDRPQTKDERIEWFLANIYCTCGVAGDRCTGHFYTLASCNPNACGLPNLTRGQIGDLIDEGKSNRQIFAELLEDRGPAMLIPHLLK